MHIDHSRFYQSSFNIYRNDEQTVNFLSDVYITKEACKNVICPHFLPNIWFVTNRLQPAGQFLEPLHCPVPQLNPPSKK